jgi:hypothetical protein
LSCGELLAIIERKFRIRMANKQKSAKKPATAKQALKDLRMRKDSARKVKGGAASFGPEQLATHQLQ